MLSRVCVSLITKLFNQNIPRHALSVLKGRLISLSVRLFPSIDNYQKNIPFEDSRRKKAFAYGPRITRPARMYHSGSFLDVLGCGISVIITIFWIGVWHLHMISIIYGKWRLHRPTTTLHMLSWKSKSVPDMSLDPHRSLAGTQDGVSSWTNNQTIIQVQTTSGLESNLTIFNGDLLPGVSILKPLVGVDQYLMQNLETFFLMKYPRFELLFCVAEESDPAIMVVQSLMHKYPQIDARIFIGGENVGVNPKINNMMPGYRASKYGLILVSDSGIMMREDTLLDMVYTLLKPELEGDRPRGRLYRWYTWIRNRGTSNGVGLVHQMPYSMDRDEFGFPACLEKVYFGTVHARIYLAADCLGINCPTGMSALMRKHLLENKGGMAAFGKYLAEDYFFAKALTDQKWTICISSQPAWQNSAVCHLGHFQDRLDRWAKLRFAMIPLATVLESFQECVTLGILASMALQFLFGLSALGVFLVHVITWFLLDWTLLKTVQNGRLSFSKLDFVIGWVFREFTCFIMFTKALVNPKIQWKNGYYRLKWGGQAEVIKAPVNEHYAVGSVPVNCYQILDHRESAIPEPRDVQHDRFDFGGCTSPDSVSVQSLDLSSPRLQSSKKRHMRTRSLPQKNSIVNLFRNLTDRIQGNDCDNMATSSFSFQTKNVRDIF